MSAPHPTPLTSGADRSASSLQDDNANSCDAVLSAAMQSLLPPSNVPSRRPSTASSSSTFAYGYSYSYSHPPAASADPFQQIALSVVLPPSPARSRSSSTSVSHSAKQPPLPSDIQPGGIDSNRSRSASFSAHAARNTPLPESPKLVATLANIDVIPNATLPPTLVIDMTQDSTFTATSIPWSIPLPQSPSSSFASSHPAQRDASSAAPVWIRNEPVIVHDTTLDMAAQLPLPMSRGGSFSHSLPSSSSTRDWTRFAQQVRLPPSSSNFATMLQDASVDLPLLQFDQGHQVPLPSSTSLLAPAMLPPLPASTSMLTPAHDVPSITLQATPVLHPPSSSSSNTFVDSGSFSSTHSAPMLAAHFPILPPSSSSLASGPSHGASSIPLPPSRSTLATLQPHTIALPPSSSHLHGQRDDGLQSANVPLPPSTSATAPSPGRSLEPAAMALPAAASDQPTANNRRDATEQDVDTWASKSGHRSSKPMLNDQVLVALRLSDPDLLSSPNSDKPPQVQSPTTHESIEQGDSSTSTAHCMPLPPSQSHLVSKSNHSSASLTRLPKSGSLTPRESSAPSRRLSQLTTSTHSLSPSSSGSVTPTDASSSVHLYRSDRSRSASSSSRALSLIEIFDIFFIYASVTSSTPVKYRQDRLLSLLRAKLGPTRMLLADITLPEFHKLRAQAIEHVKAKGFKVPPWPVVVLQVRVVEGNASGASLAFKEEVDPTDAGEVRAAWTAGDEEAGGGCERTWIAHEEIEEAMEMGTLDELLQLEHEDEVEVEGTQDDGELDEEKESDVREKDESE